MHKLNVRINSRVSVSVEAVDMKTLVKEGAFWSEIPPACPECGQEFNLTYRTPQEFEYYGLKCLGSPSHQINFGEFKDSNRGLYYKNSERWSVYGQRDQGNQGDQRDYNQGGNNPGNPANQVMYGQSNPPVQLQQQQAQTQAIHQQPVQQAPAQQQASVPYNQVVMAGPDDDIPF